MIKSRITHILLAIFLIGFRPIHAQEIVINEFMAANNNSILDEDGESSDWIELYNRGGNTVNLEGYHLSDNENNLQKWTFPKIDVKPGEFLLIFASGKGFIGINSIHTNFKISSEGEPLFLSDGQGVIIDQFEEIELQEDESFGRLPDGSEHKTFLSSSSPGTTNNNFNKLTFSHPPGFYDSPIELSINSILGDAIFYTLDGSEPTPQSHSYSSQLLLKDNTSSPNVWCEIPTTPVDQFLSYKAWESPGVLVSKANIIRCASFRDGVKTSDTYSRTFLISSDIFDRYNMPVISLVTEGDHFFDHDTGIYVPGAKYDPSSPEWTGNYFTGEIESERPIHIEYFDLDGNLRFYQNAGIRIHGGKTRHASQKSLRLYARKEYGESYFNYPLMPQNGVQKYQRFLLQTTMGAWGGKTVIKDVLAHEIVKDLDIEHMDYQPVVVFINGEYWGIHNLRDRIDEEYLSYTSGIDLDSLEIDRGGNNHFNDMRDYIKDNLPINNEDLDYIATQMDIDGYIDYQIAEMFLNNYDWPANNSKHWRPTHEQGKWRWIFYDIDAGFGDPDYNMLEHNTKDDPTISWPNHPRSTFIFRSLIANDVFRNQFISRYKELLETDFRTSNTKEKLSMLIDQYQSEMVHHITRWHFPPSRETWLKDVEKSITNFLESRPCAVTDHISDFFDLPDFQVDCKDSLDQDNQPIYLTGFAVLPNPNHGIFYIQNKSINSRSFDVILLNAIGQAVYQTNSLFIEGSSRIMLSNSSLTPGIYYLRIKEPDSVFTIPLVVANQ